MIFICQLYLIKAVEEKGKYFLGLLSTSQSSMYFSADEGQAQTW